MGCGRAALALAPRRNTSHRRQIATFARDQMAGTVRRRLSAESGCRLRLFTCMPVDVPRVRIIRNDFSWVRARYPVPQLKPGADLVGTSLVENGVVKADAYLDGVETLIAQHEADRYVAHRKEAGWKLDLIERLGIDVVRPTLPLEIIARRGPIGSTIISFPSTVVHTLPTVLVGSDVQVVLCDIATSGTSPRLGCKPTTSWVESAPRRARAMA